MPQTKPVISVENVVASASVDQKIDLIEVTKKHPKTEYHPEQFPGLVFRLENPRRMPKPLGHADISNR